jgi:hypothetical protein
MREQHICGGYDLSKVVDPVPGTCESWGGAGGRHVKERRAEVISRQPVPVQANCTPKILLF